jgi:hypothetical protein
MPTIEGATGRFRCSKWRVSPSLRPAWLANGRARRSPPAARQRTHFIGKPYRANQLPGEVEDMLRKA